jgi:hypothetical protein
MACPCAASIEPVLESAAAIPAAYFLPLAVSKRGSALRFLEPG